MVQMQYLWSDQNFVFAGQPEVSQFEEFKNKGISVVINIRGVDEFDFAAQEEKVKELGLEYHHIPFLVDGEPSAQACAEIDRIVNSNKGKKILIHCKSANRVGGWYAWYLHKHTGEDPSASIVRASRLGLAAQPLKEKMMMLMLS